MKSEKYRTDESRQKLDVQVLSEREHGRRGGVSLQGETASTEYGPGSYRIEK